MARGAVYAALAACVVWLSGCGTMLNLPAQTGLVVLDTTPPEQVYGGVKRDAESLASGSDTSSGVSLGSLVEGVCRTCFLLLDLPLSAVADTLTLPITLRSGTPAAGPDAKQPQQPVPADTPTPEPGQRAAFPTAVQHPGP
jgi:uncharacterized protein YceK